jgi:8-oxo-dGTP pyrophosphatase MutT (NUDIX family)
MESTIRKTARAIILTPQQDVLFMRMAFLWSDGDIWMLPGGGIKAGETARSAVLREVYEETSAVDLDIQGEVWRQDLRIEARNILLQQRYFLIEAKRFIPKPAELTVTEISWVQEYRWWQIDQFEAIENQMEPKCFPRLIKQLMQNGVPDTPTDISIL